MDEAPTVPVSPHDDDDEPAPFEPFRFGKYEILEELGRGGMGVVYRAHQTDLDRTVAIKMILARHLAAPGFAARFHAEAKAAAKVNHPNIVGVFETGVHHNQHFIAMEFVKGKNLSDLFAHREIDLRDAARVLAEIARAVHFLHEQQILHRDLKPSNIMVAEDGHPVLTDFGLALIRGADGEGGDGIVGTPGYIAPEIISGGIPEASERSDVYSLGATLYEAATGRSPFGDRSPVDAFVHVLDKDPQPPRAIERSIPLALETIILECLERDPERRYASAVDLAFDLDQFLIGEPIRATPPAGLVRARRWVRGHTALASRLFGFATFFLITLWNTYAIDFLTPRFFASVAIGLGVWTGASIVCELLEARHQQLARVAWTAVDAIVLTTLLLVANGVASPLVLAFPLWVAMSGFWTRVSLVVLTTTLALLSYGVLILDTVWNRPELSVGIDRHLIFGSVVTLTGLVIGMQTRRARAMSLYLARRG